MADFNPRSREGSDLLRCLRLFAIEYFNPRSREGSDACKHQQHSDQYAISIHAPVKGATVISSVCWTQGLISIHAPVKGATLRDLARKRRSNISIHAPVKGATRLFRLYDLTVDHFNPRSREGSDHARKARVRKARNFNPRSREGSDEKRLHPTFPASKFQSTLP